MKIPLIAILFFITCFNVIAQKTELPRKKIYLKSVGDTYVVKLSLNESILSDKCNCLITDPVCNLFKGEIKSIYLLPDKQVLYDFKSLQLVSYFIMGSTKSLELNKNYIVTLSPTTSMEYLRINTIIDLDSMSNYLFVHSGPYLSNLTNCYKIGFFNSILVGLGVIGREKINYSNKNKQKDKFLEFIVKNSNK